MIQSSEGVLAGVFVDTSAYFALGDTGDAENAVAQLIAERLVAERWRPFTTNFIVAETHALIIARQHRLAAARFLQEIDATPDTTIVRVSAADERRAREIIHGYSDKDFSLTDALSFAVMERLRIGHAFTFDRRFAQYGFALLGPSSEG